MNLRNHITTASLALAGLGLWAFAGSSLQKDGGFKFEPNPLGLKRSPYGQVLAMAVQGPVDADFHMVMASGAPVEGTEGLDATEAPEESTHVCGAGCDHDHDHPLAESAPLIDKLEFIATRRTNPNPPTPAHKFYLRSKIEERLRFAYELDPSHYGNYNSYHLFLTEPELGTETTKEQFFEGRKRADRLAEYTIRYCLAQDSDPRPALTAATAAYNILETMFFQEQEHSLEEMSRQLGLIDHCLQRYDQLLDNSLKDGSFELLSPMRQQELLDRAMFTVRLFDTARSTLSRIASERTPTASHEDS